MSTITSILSGDLPTNSRSTINTNFSNLNTDKIETSVIDTDTALAANSDAKLASQKATKAYADSVVGTPASTTVKGVVEEATVAEIGAGTAAGGTSARLFINPSSTVSTSAGAADVGKLPRLNASGKLDATFGWPMTSGTTTHDISSTATDTIAHSLTTAPRLVKVTLLFANATSISITVMSYSSAASRGVFAAVNEAGAQNTSGSTGTVSDIGNGTGNVATIGAPDATNFTLTWSKNGAPTGTVYIIWEAFS